MTELSYIDLSVKDYGDYRFEFPRECPHCGESITPEFIHKTNNVHDNVALLVRCTRCRKYYALAYELLDERIRANIAFILYKARLIKYTYKINVSYDLPEEIEKISPEAKEIYTQSLEAEAYNLFHIAGIGYRKSIEFLIKDYLIKLKCQDEKTVSKLSLSKAIKKIDNEDIQTLAQASTWIGNDETHYTRKHPDKDVNDLKKFLKALSQLLSSEYLVKEALSMIKENLSNKSN